MATRGLNIPLDIGASITPLVGKTGNNTYQEDNPSAPSPARITHMANVLPTTLGYNSAFAPILPDDWNSVSAAPIWVREQYSSDKVANALKSARIQHVIPWETGAQERVFIILAEGGVFLYNPAAERNWNNISEYDDTLTLYETIKLLPPDTAKFNLWTYAAVSNRLYIYRQGLGKVYVIGDTTLATDASNWNVTVETLYTKEDSLFQVVAITPSFLNMEGQVGLFKAGNRLGFWDSDNAIAWSSAFIPVDFTPDVVSLAGITTFSDIAGDIVTILPTTDGFMVYSTGSIVRIDPLTSSAERWGATVIRASGGIDFYTQATVGGDPEYHVAWTQRGVLEIAGRQARTILHEEYQHLSSLAAPNGTPYLYMVTLVGDTYLLVSQASEWQLYQPNNAVRLGTLKGKDRDYYFYLPAIPEGGKFIPGWFHVVAGTIPDFIDQELDPEEWEEPNPNDLPPLHEAKPLIPFYTGYRYQTPNILRTNGWPTFEQDESDSVPRQNFVSGAWPEIYFKPQEEVNLRQPDGGCMLKPSIVNGPWTMPAQVPQWLIPDWWARQDTVNTDYPRRFIDAAGQDFMDIVDDTMLKLNQDIAKYWSPETGIIQYPTQLDKRAICQPFDGESLEGRSALGWEAYGYSLDQHTRKLEEGEKLTDLLDLNRLHHIEPRTAEEVEANEFLTESEYESLRQYLYGDNLLTPQIHRQFKQTMAREVPFDLVAPRVVQNSCGIFIYVFIDDVSGAMLRYGETGIYEEAQHRDYTTPNYDWKTVYNAPVHQETEGPFLLNYLSWNLVQSMRVFPSSWNGKSRTEINKMMRPTDDELEHTPQWRPVFIAELSGLGYATRVSSTWTTYRKTISRARLWMSSPDGECTPRGPSISLNTEDPGDVSDPTDDVFSYLWDSASGFSGEPPQYKPPEIGDGPNGYDNYYWPVNIAYGAVFREGTKAPLYPIYDKAWVLDRELDKWGSIDLAHSQIFQTAPINSLSSSVALTWGNYDVEVGSGKVMPFGIVPKFPVPELSDPNHNGWEDIYNWLEWSGWDYPKQYQLPTLVASTGAAGQLEIDSIALTRDGYTKLVGVSGKDLYQGSVRVRGSYQGSSFERSAYLGINRESISAGFLWATSDWNNSERSKEFSAPFVLIGKEFQIAIEGSFKLHKLLCYGQPTGALRFHGPRITGGLD